MYNIGDIIVLYPWDTLKQMFGFTKCDKGHECINTNPILIDRYKNQYEQGMRINGIFEGLYQTNQCVVPHDAVSHIKEYTTPETPHPIDTEVQAHTFEYDITQGTIAEQDPRGEDREAAREAGGGCNWADTVTLTISTD